MAGQLSLEGAQLTATPACSGGSFPAGISNLPLALNPCAKPYSVTTGIMQANVAATEYAAIGGIGSSGPVTKANFLLLQSNVPMQVQLTLADSSTPVVFLNGLFVMETETGKEVTGVEVIGSGTLQYFASGLQ